MPRTRIHRFFIAKVAEFDSYHGCQVLLRFRENLNFGVSAIISVCALSMLYVSNFLVIGVAIFLLSVSVKECELLNGWLIGLLVSLIVLVISDLFRFFTLIRAVCILVFWLSRLFLMSWTVYGSWLWFYPSYSRNANACFVSDNGRTVIAVHVYLIAAWCEMIVYSIAIVFLLMNDHAVMTNYQSIEQI